MKKSSGKVALQKKRDQHNAAAQACILRATVVCLMPEKRESAQSGLRVGCIALTCDLIWIMPT